MFPGGLESFISTLAWKVSTANKFHHLHNLEGILTHQSHISQVFFRYQGIKSSEGMTEDMV